MNEASGWIGKGVGNPVNNAPLSDNIARKFDPKTNIVFPPFKFAPQPPFTPKLSVPQQTQALVKHMNKKKVIKKKAVKT